MAGGTGPEQQYREVYSDATDEGEPSEFDGRLEGDVGSAGANDMDTEGIIDERGRSGKKRRFRSRTPNNPRLSGSTMKRSLEQRKMKRKRKTKRHQHAQTI